MYKRQHGAGGITPDVFVALDTIRWSGYLSDLSWSGTLRDAAFAYVDAHREAAERQLQGAGDGLESEALLNFLIEYAQAEGIPPPVKWTSEERNELSNRMAAQVIRNGAGEQAYYAFLTQGDDAVERAVYWLKNKSRMAIVDGRLTLLPESQ